MAKHWIITNRGVDEDATDGHGVKDGSQSKRLNGLPTFRVATFDADGLGDKPSKKDLLGAVRFVKDGFVDDYRGILEGGTPRVGSAQMFRELYDSMREGAEADASPETRVCDAMVFLHGFNYTWADSLKHLHRLVRVYADESASPVKHVVYLSWPSWGSQLRYRSDQEIALQAGIAFGRLFAKVVHFYRDVFGPDPEDPAHEPAAFCGGRVHLAAHSMGNQVLEQFMRAFSGLSRLRAPVFGECLLLHADADWTALEPGNPLHGLPSFADRIHVYNHTSDDALKISEHTKNDARRLGRHGPRTVSPERLSDRTVVVDCSDLRGKPGKPASTPVNERRMHLLTGADGAMPSAAREDFVSTARRVLDLEGGAEVSARERMFDHWGYLHRPEEVADVWQVLRGVSSSRVAGREDRSGPIYRLLPA